MNAGTVYNPLGPVGGSGFSQAGTSSGWSPQSEAWVMIALFGVGFLALMAWGFIGGQLDVSARGGAGRSE